MEGSTHKAFPACARFRSELPAHLEGEASPFITSHAQECGDCGGLLADLQAIRLAARTLPREEPSPAVWLKVRARLEAEGAFAAPACLRFEEELDDFLEGDNNPFVAAHAKDCAACGALLADFQAIRAAARKLPTEEPSRVVWANVRARLEAQGALGTPVSGWRQIFSWQFLPHAIPAGVLAALVLLGSALTLPSYRLPPGNGAQAAADSSAIPPMAPAFLTHEDSLLASVVSDLESSFKANESSMAPDLKATYDKSLVSLDGSIEQCLDSLRQEPGNTLAHDYLLTAYTRKAEVLSSALEFEGR